MAATDVTSYQWCKQHEAAAEQVGPGIEPDVTVDECSYCWCQLTAHQCRQLNPFRDGLRLTAVPTGFLA